MRVALAATILGFVPGLLDPFNGPKAAALRLIGLPLLAFAVTGAITRRSLRLAALDCVVIAWTIVTTASTVFGLDPGLSLLGEVGQREGLLTTLSLAGLYAGIRASHTGPGHVRATLGTIAGALVLATTYALVQVAGLDPLRWSEAHHYVAGDTDALRPFATFGNPILLGAALAAGLGLAAARAIRGQAWLHVPVVALFAAAIAATLSRGAWLAAGAAVAIVVACAWRAAPRPPARSALALGAAFALAALWSTVLLRAPVVARLSEGLGRGASNDARVEIARGALALWRAHPWLGTGPDTFGLAFPGVQSAAFWGAGWLGLPVHAHSAVLQALATGGAMTTLLGATWIVLVVRALARTPLGPEADPERIGLGAMLAALAVAGALNAVGPAGAALCVAVGAMAVSLGPRSRASRAGRAGVAVVVAVLVATVVAWAGWRELSALASAGRARGRFAIVANAPEGRAQLLDDAVRDAAAATDAFAIEDGLWRLRSDLERGLALERLRERDASGADTLAGAAERSARRALALVPARAANFQRLGNALATRALVRRALDEADARAIVPATRAEAWAVLADSAFSGARRRAPVDALILADEARAALSLRRPERALEAARRIVALDGAAATGHAIEGAAWLLMGRRDEAMTALRRARDSRWEDGSQAERAEVERLLRALEHL